VDSRTSLRNSAIRIRTAIHIRLEPRCPEATEVRSAPDDVIGADAMVGRIATGEAERDTNQFRENKAPANGEMVSAACGSWHGLIA
jgi:hypothetical protein